jgi:uncharacterized protein
MKLSYIFPAAMAAFVLAVPASADEVKRSVSVTGEAEVRVVPDEVIVQMSVESRDKALMPAVNETNKAIAAVTALATKTLKLPAKHVQTDYIQIQPNYVTCRDYSSSPSSCDPTKIQYYQARRGIEIRLRDLGKFDNLIAESLKAGITYIDNVEFRTTELRKHRDKAREMAAQAAKEKAQAAATALGAKLGPVTSISVDNVYWSYGNPSRGRGGPMTQNVMQEAGGGDEGAGLALGQISVTARISATFGLE